MRHNFTQLTKEILAKRVSYKCSNPNCKKITIGPHSKDDKVLNIGVAAHITAASKGGPRYCEEMKFNERTNVKNGIWLCQNCAKLIDTDIKKYSVDELVKWKSLAEEESLAVISNDFLKLHKNSTLFERRIIVYQELHSLVREVDRLIRELLKNQELSEKEKVDATSFLALQVAKFTDDNSFYLQDEISMQCFLTFVIGDIFSSNEIVKKEHFNLYNKNVRASQKLLKSVDSKGIIDTSKKTEIMAYHSELERKYGKEDFI